MLLVITFGDGLIVVLGRWAGHRVSKIINHWHWNRPDQPRFAGQGTN